MVLGRSTMLHIMVIGIRPKKDKGKKMNSLGAPAIKTPATSMRTRPLRKIAATKVAIKLPSIKAPSVKSLGTKITPSTKSI